MNCKERVLIGMKLIARTDCEVTNNDKGCKGDEIRLEFERFDQTHDGRW